MSVLRTANVHFDGTGTVRIGKDGSDIKIAGAPTIIDASLLTVSGNCQFSQNVNVAGTLMVNGQPVGGALDITNDTAAATRYITFIPTTTGTADALNVSSVALTFNASTGQVSANDFNTLSDAALKEDFMPLDNPLMLIDTVNGVRFRWKGSDRKSVGLIAQEVEKVLPEAVTSDKHITYSGVIALLVECIKELKREVEELKNDRKSE